MNIKVFQDVMFRKFIIKTRYNMNSNLKRNIYLRSNIFSNYYINSMHLKEDYFQ